MLGLDTYQWYAAGLAAYLIVVLSVAIGTLWLARNGKRLYCMFVSIHL